MTKTTKILGLLVFAVLCIMIKLGTSLTYYPGLFALLLSFFNWKLHKFNSMLGLLANILSSYVILFFNVYGFMIVGKIISFWIPNVGTLKIYYFPLAFTFCMCIGTLFTFWLYGFIFKISRSKYVTVLKLINITTGGIVLYFFESVVFFMFSTSLMLHLAINEDNYNIKDRLKSIFKT